MEDGDDAYRPQVWAPITAAQALQAAKIGGGALLGRVAGSECRGAAEATRDKAGAKKRKRWTHVSASTEKVLNTRGSLEPTIVAIWGFTDKN